MSAVSIFAAIGTAALAAKKAIDFSREGAEIDYIENKFSRLASAIGTTESALKRDLRAATKNTIGDAKLLASAADLMSLGLAKSHDEAVRLARIVGALNMDMNELTLTLTNKTKRRFDQLGVAVDGFDDRLEDLKATGMNVDDAFKEAFLQQAEEQILKVGDAAESSMGDMMRFEAAIKNLGSGIKQDLSRSIIPALGGLTDFIRLLNVGREAVEKGAISQRELNLAVYSLILPGREAADVIEELTKKYEAYEEAVTRAANEAMRMAEAQLLVFGFEVEEPDLREQLLEQIIEKGRQTGAETAIAFGETFNAQMEALNLSIEDPLGQLKEQFRETEYELAEEAARLRDAIASIEGRPITTAGRAELQALQTEFANTKQAIYENMEAYEQETKVALFGILQQRLAHMELSDTQRQVAFQMMNDIAYAWGIVSETTYNALSSMDSALAAFAAGNVKAAQAEIINLGIAASMVEGDYYIKFHVTYDYGMGVTQGPTQEGEPPAGTPVPGHPRTPAPGHVPRIGDWVDDLIDSLFPPGTFAPPDLGGIGKGIGEDIGDGIEEGILEEIDPVRLAFNLGSALSGLGQTAASMYQKETIDPLRQELEKIEDLLTPGHVDLVARERAAELEEQRAQAAKELAEAEKKVLEFQEAQSKLRLIEQQFRLLDIIKEQELDAKDILGGIKLGIDAEMSDIIEAMTRAINELIAQTEKELEIGSPSKVFTDIFEQVTAGASKGIMVGLPSLRSSANELMGTVLPSGAIIGPSYNERSGGRASGRPLQINVYPSAGMDENQLARKVVTIANRRLR